MVVPLFMTYGKKGLAPYEVPVINSHNSAEDKQGRVLSVREVRPLSLTQRKLLLITQRMLWRAFQEHWNVYFAWSLVPWESLCLMLTLMCNSGRLTKLCSGLYSSTQFLSHTLISLECYHKPDRLPSASQKTVGNILKAVVIIGTYDLASTQLI